MLTHSDSPASSCLMNNLPLPPFVRKGLLLAWFGLALLISGCGTLPQGAEPPEVSLVSFRLQEMRVIETDVVFILRIDNDGPVPMTLSGGVHRVYIDGMRIGKAQSNQRVFLPPFTSTTQEVLAHVSNLRFATRLTNILTRGSYDYRLKSNLFLEGDAGTLHQYPVSSEGRVDFNTFRPAAPHGVAIPLRSRP